MLKIKDNTIKSGYKNNWYFKEYQYIDEFDINSKEEFEKYDIKFVIDEILKDEGYVINFENIAFLGAEEVIYYDFDDRYSIELYTLDKNKHTLSFILKEIDSFEKLYELEYMRYLYNKIIKRIKSDIVEKV